MLHIGTLGLAACDCLCLLPFHCCDRFPRFLQEPDPGSRHLYAGRPLGSQHASPRLIPKQRTDSGFDDTHSLSTPQRRFTCVRLPRPYLTCFPRLFPDRSAQQLVTAAPSKRFDTRSYNPTPRGQPSSLIRQGRTLVGTLRSWRTFFCKTLAFHRFLHYRETLAQRQHQ